MCFLSVGVFASALSPMMMGVMIDHGHALPELMGLNIALAVTAQIGAVLFLRLATPQINQ